MGIPVNTEVKLTWTVFIEFRQDEFDIGGISACSGLREQVRDVSVKPDTESPDSQPIIHPEGVNGDFFRRVETFHRVSQTHRHAQVPGQAVSRTGWDDAQGGGGAGQSGRCFIHGAVPAHSYDRTITHGDGFTG